MTDLHLYINQEEVELGSESLILYNWSETDLSNPVDTQNSFSRVITLQGTKKNNKIFNHIWNLERVQTYGNNTINPSKRIPFTITYDGGNIFESGYCKLQNIKLVNGVYQYEFTLFGQIGNFLNNLGTNFSDGSVKTLADLTYHDDNDELQDLDFTINAETVKEAWQNIGRGKWSILNFANTYNGIPTNLDADKVLIDGVNGYYPFLKRRVTEDGVTYEPANDRVIVNTNNKLTKDETKDLRSYLLTPVISCKRIIDAIARPENNSGEFDEGFNVELDNTFFNHNNPYYENAFMTLPNITNLKLTNTTKDNTETILTTMSFVKTERINSNFRFIYNIELPATLTEWSEFDITVGFGSLFNYPTWYSKSDMYFRSNLKKLADFINADSIQAYAIANDGEDYENIIAGSNIVWLTSDNYATLKNGNTQIFTYENAVKYRDYVPKVTPERVDSSYRAMWRKLGTNNYHTLITDGDNNNYEIKLKLSAPVGTKNVRVCLDMVRGIKGFGDTVFLPDPFDDGETSTAYRIQEVGYYNLYAKYSAQNSFYSNKLITKQNLLTTNYSVKDWLLSYCKMFGLYIWYDKNGERLHIDTRNTFYQRNKLVNINGQIDYSRDYSIKPVIAENNFYTMTQEQYDSDLAEDYKTVYGKVYGNKTIDTGANLDLSTKELVNIKFKSAIMNNKQSLYNFIPTEVEGVSGVTTYLCGGITYNLYNGQNTLEVKKEAYDIQQLFEGKEQGYKMYADTFNKVMLEKDGKGGNGENVILFYSGYKDVYGKGYYLSDDIPAMATLNDKPTWILTNNFTSKDYLQQITQIPDFSRYWVENGHILFSLDFGSPRKLYIDSTINHEESTLYYNFYKTYYEDLYDVNTKQINCYFLPKNVLSIGDIRQFYWFNNSLWRLNKIIDYNPQKKDLVKVEFIKVQDKENMNSVEPSTILKVTVKLDSYSIGYDGGTIKGSVITSDYGSWTVEDDDGLFVFPSGATTNSEIIIDVPANTGDTKTYNLTIAGGDVTGRATITQSAGTGEIGLIRIIVDNQTPFEQRVGLNLMRFQFQTTYMNIKSGDRAEYGVPIPFGGERGAYDLIVEGPKLYDYDIVYKCLLSDGTEIKEYDLDDFNDSLTHINAQLLHDSIITLEINESF